MAFLIPWLAIIPEYQRAAVFRLGRFAGLRGPGLVFVSPMLERIMIVDVRVMVVDVPPQECISKDNVPLKVNAVVYFKVADPRKAIVDVFDYRKATVEIAQTTLRSVIGTSPLDKLLSDRTEIAEELQTIIDQATDEWGVKVNRVEIKDLEIPGGLRRAMAKEAEAERERRAMVIRAAGEKEAAQQLAEAAKLLDASPNGFQMRYLQTLLQVAERGNTVVFAPSASAGHTALAAHAHAHALKAQAPPVAPEDRDE
ncbi:MAG: regulator of protease activity HflC (stomatin/prohibitin superfamily) [Myxococcota bacterium]|jgi:regulator of protease activity HflC (stomatin/prohibitin superfamily)